MKVLLVAPVSKPEMTAHLILRSLKAFGIQVETFDYRIITAEIGVGQMNLRLLQIMEDMDWKDLVLIIKGESLSPEIFKKVKPRRALWYFDYDSKEPPEWLINLGRFMSGTFLMCFPWVEELCEAGIKCFFLPQGTDPWVYHPVGVRPEKRCDIAFIGGKKAGREEFLAPLQKKYDLKIWGEHWGDDIKPAYLEDFNEVISNSKIVINLIHSPDWPKYPCTFSQRIYMVLAAAGCLMTDTVPGMHEFFKPDQEIVWYDKSNLEEKIDDLLANPEKRISLRLRGRERVLREHTYGHRIRRLLECLRLSPSALKSS